MQEEGARKFPNGHTVFVTVAFALFLISLLPVWSLHLLPMQDLPPHLFLSKLLQSNNDPGSLWSRYYDVQFTVRPYVVWYAFMEPLMRFFDVYTSSKILLSLYLFSTLLLVFYLYRNRKNDTLPWAALFLFPLAFNQNYFMGFVNYFTFIPLQVYTLVKLHKDLSEKGDSSFLFGFITFVFFFFAHPFVFLTQVGLTLAIVYYNRDRVKNIFKPVLPLIPVAAVFAVWYLTVHGAPENRHDIVWTIGWPSLDYLVVYFLLFFTGMNFFRPDWISVGCWVLFFAGVFLSWKRSGGFPASFKWPVTMFLVVLATYALIPRHFGYYAYFNTRLAPLACYFLFIALSTIPFGRVTAGIATVAAVLLTIQSIMLQTQASVDIETILPVLAKMKKNAAVLPLVFEGEATGLDDKFFFQIHDNDASIYQLEVGGGVTPDLFPSSMLPAKYKEGVAVPKPLKLRYFIYSDYAPFYDYILARGTYQDPWDAKRIETDLLKNGKLVAVSGKWRLYETERAARLR